MSKPRKPRRRLRRFAIAERRASAPRLAPDRRGTPTPRATPPPTRRSCAEPGMSRRRTPDTRWSSPEFRRRLPSRCTSPRRISRSTARLTRRSRSIPRSATCKPPRPPSGPSPPRTSIRPRGRPSAASSTPAFRSPRTRTSRRMTPKSPWRSMSRVTCTTWWCPRITPTTRSSRTEARGRRPRSRR